MDNLYFLLSILKLIRINATTKRSIALRRVDEKYFDSVRPTNIITLTLSIYAKRWVSG
jgi:hypothetical protein